MGTKDGDRDRDGGEDQILDGMSYALDHFMSLPNRSRASLYAAPNGLLAAASAQWAS